MIRPAPNFIAIDVETTGLEKDAAITEIGLAFFSDGKHIHSWQSFVNPMRPIPQDISLLTGITDAMVQGAPVWEVLEDEFLEQIEDALLVGHNIAFDLEKIREHTGRPLSNAYLDTHDLAKLFLPQLTSYKLAAIAAHFDIFEAELHRALNDAVVCGKVLEAILQTAMGIDPFVLSEMSSLFPKDPETLFQSGGNALAPILNDIVQGAMARSFEAVEDEVLEIIPQEELRPRLSFAESDSFFAEDGLLSETMPSFEYREPQVTLIREIKAAFEKNVHGIFEAGTGTGKTFSYLVPALLWSYEKEVPVVISTNTINLQEQIFHQDLPFLREALGYPFEAALVKGRSNYLCLRRYENQKNAAPRLKHQERIFIASLIPWLNGVYAGDREQLNLNQLEGQWWQSISSSRETCSSRSCPYYGECFFFGSRRRSDKADLLVVNHSLLLQDMKLEGSILPDYKQVVIDEAHHLEDEASRQFTDVVDFELSRKRLQASFRSKGPIDRLAKSLAEIPSLEFEAEDLGEDISRLQSDSENLADRLAQIIKKAVDVPEIDRVAELRITDKIRQSPWWEDLAESFHDLLRLWQHFNQRFTALLNRVGQEESLEDSLRELSFNRDILVEQAEWLKRYLEDSDPKLVYWASGQKTGWGSNLQLFTATIDIMPILKEQLFEQNDSVILTSATLAVNQNLSYTAKKFLLEEDGYLATITPSPFDYKTQSCIAIPSGQPDVSKSGEAAFTRRVIKDLTELIPAVGGDMLILFTSYAMLNRAYFALKTEPGLKNFLILGHGRDGSRTSIIETMQAKRGTVVLGAASFWEGVDVQGDHLRTVVITKLPFQPPAMPMESAKTELLQSKGKNPFASHSLPNAILRFRQGCGRLIRSRQDQGNIVILDNRVLTKSYGKQFLNSLPEQPIIKDDMTGIAMRLAERSKERFQ